MARETASSRRARGAQADKSEATNVPEDEGQGSGFQIEEADPAQLKIVRRTTLNPLLEAVQSSLAAEKALQIVVKDAEMASDVENMLRRAAKALGCGLSMRNTGTHIIFQGKAVKRSRKYSTEQIREWARENGATEEMLYPRVDMGVREAFRKAHGFVKVKKDPAE